MGKLISIDGMDGSGKTTVINSLLKLKRFKTYNLFKVKGPELKNKSPLHILNRSLKTEQELMRELSSRRDYIQDRSIATTFAYNYKLVYPLYTFQEYKAIMFDHLRKLKRLPDIIIYLDVDPYNAFNRLQGRDNFTIKDLQTLKSLYELVLEYLSNQGIDICRVDANKTKEEVKKEVELCLVI